MRLTLRTLLAWLDDTLPPAEVREIGHLVNETPFAKELIERIHRVARQRRLTVPNGGGTEGTDPAVVASYLDNQLGPEQVAEFEKKCLTSDVHLAEVASVHQILSLIGQKAKVPPEAKQRMYHLVRGREAVRSKAPRIASTAPPEPVAAPVAPWVPAEFPRRPPWERYWPVAAVVALMGLLGWSAVAILGPSTRTGGGTPLAVTPVNETPRPGVPGQPKEAVKTKEAVPPGPGRQAPEKGLVAATTAGAVDATRGAEPGPAAGPEEPPADASTAKAAEPTPPGAIGVVGQADGILLRAVPAAAADKAKTKWERLAAQATLHEGDRIASLDPFRSTVTLGPIKVELVQGTEIVVEAPAADSAARFELARGRVVVHGPPTPSALVVDFAKVPVTLTTPADGVVGLERINHRAPGSVEPVAPALRVSAPRGEFALAITGAEARLDGPGSVLFQPPQHFAPPEAGDPPAWVTESGPSPVQRRIGTQFASYFKDGTAMIAALMGAQTDEQKEVRRLAIEALGEVVSLDVVATALSTRGDQVSRRAAIGVLRDRIARGPGAMHELRTRLEEVGGAPWASAVERLLIGFSPADASKEKTYVGLVADLKNPDVGIRELALENLMALTGRDSLGFDPDQPEGPGYRAWKDLLDRKELPPKAEPSDEDAADEP